MNYVVDDGNAAITSVTWMGSTFAGPNGNVAFDGVPLGTTADGEVAVKVIVAGAGGTVGPATWIRHSALLGASASQVIPDGALYSYAILSGTASDGTVSGISAGVADSSPVPISTGFTLSTDSASSAFVVWFTRA